MNAPQAAADSYEIAPGMHALPHGVLWCASTRTLIVADAHLAYEDVIGGALPLWSTAECVATLAIAVAQRGARELVFLGDAIHGSAMSQGAAREVARALAALRERCDVIAIAGNHEGRTRGVDVLGATVEGLERDGWLLTHGDVAKPAYRCVVGHLHPSLSLDGGTAVPAFLGDRRLIVVPAFTPYSSGLDALSSACALAIATLGGVAADLTVVAADGQRVYPFGRLGDLKTALRAQRGGGGRSRFHVRHLRSDR
ncbi:MAG TPA: metallophosphoesterase [Verrucomicrobiae bacterium]|nr:metallophosphoesterase [Verrucomicrobiae bacterium]